MKCFKIQGYKIHGKHMHRISHVLVYKISSFYTLNDKAFLFRVIQNKYAYT